MKAAHTFLGTTFLLLVWPSISSAQAEKSASPATEPPKILLLVHQEFRFGKAVERQKLEAAISRACEHLNVPNDWIDLESISGPPEALFFDPFDSFSHVDTAFADWGRIFSDHPELARMQEESQALVTSERTIIAVRRDDLGYRPHSIDLSKPRFLPTHA